MDDLAHDVRRQGAEATSEVALHLSSLPPMGGLLPSAEHERQAAAARLMNAQAAALERAEPGTGGST